MLHNNLKILAAYNKYLFPARVAGPWLRFGCSSSAQRQAVAWEQVHVSSHLGTQAKGAGALWGMPFSWQRAQERKAWWKLAMPLEPSVQEQCRSHLLIV